MELLRNAIIQEEVMGQEDVIDRRTSSDLYNQRVVAFAPTPQDARPRQKILEQDNIAFSVVTQSPRSPLRSSKPLESQKLLAMIQRLHKQ